MRKSGYLLSRTTAALFCASTVLLPGAAYASTGDDSAGGPGYKAEPAASASSTAQALVTTSHYVVLFGSDQDDPERIGYRTGCTDGQSGVSGLRVLFFGTQESGGKVRPPGTTFASPAPRVDEASIERAALGWIRGFTECGSATTVVAIATNNKSDGGVSGSDAGAAWARLVERIGAQTHDGRVTVGGGLDGEPSWSPPDWARGWVDNFVKGSNRGLYAAASADGCLVGNGDRCNNGWTVQDVYHMATGAGPNVYAVPQIYRTDGIQARQWAGISRGAEQAGQEPVRFASALTQQKACQQKPPCDNTSNSPSNARDQLGEALSGSPYAAADVEGPPNLGGPPDLRGSGRPDPRRSGSGHPGPWGPGPYREGPIGPGPNHPGPNRPGPNAPGPNHPGPNAPGPNHPGPNHPGPNHPGPNAPGPGVPAPTAPVPAVPGAGGLTVPGPTAPGQNHPGPNAPAQNGPAQNGPAQAGPIQNGPIQNGPVQAAPVATVPSPAAPGPSAPVPAVPGPTAPPAPGPNTPGPAGPVPGSSGPKVPGSQVPDTTAPGPRPFLSDSQGSAVTAFGSTDVAWPEDQSALAWVTTQPSVPGGPTG